MPPIAATPPPRATARPWTRIRAFRAEEPEAQVRRRMETVRQTMPAAPEIARALRLARKAALSRRLGESGYDPVRHAALLRLARGAPAHAVSRPQDMAARP